MTIVEVSGSDAISSDQMHGFRPIVHKKHCLGET